MRVQATKLGFYNNYLHEIGEVFDLLNDENGDMPLRMIKVEVKGADGKPTGEFVEEVYLDEKGNPMHRDFSPHDMEWRGVGHFKGDVFREGWMRIVPDDTPLGIWPDREFGLPAKAPIQRTVRAEGTPLNIAQSAPVRGKIDRTVHRGG